MSIYTDTITQSYLKQILHYDPDTGEWTWIVSKSNRVPVGSKAGRRNQAGYLRITIGGKTYQSTHLAFLYMTGSWPKEYVDHIDRNIMNDKWNNLREATPAENSQNQKIAKNNTSGYKGVCWCDKRNKWYSQIWIERKRIKLGRFDTIEDAINARKEAEQKYHGEFVI